MKDPQPKHRSSRYHFPKKALHLLKNSFPDLVY